MEKQELKFIAIRLDKQLHKAAKQQALKEDLTLQDWLKKLIIHNID